MRGPVAAAVRRRIPLWWIGGRPPPHGGGYVFQTRSNLRTENHRNPGPRLRETPNSADYGRQLPFPYDK